MVELLKNCNGEVEINEYFIDLMEVQKTTASLAMLSPKPKLGDMVPVVPKAIFFFWNDSEMVQRDNAESML